MVNEWILLLGGLATFIGAVFGAWKGTGSLITTLMKNASMQVASYREDVESLRKRLETAEEQIDLLIRESQRKDMEMLEKDRQVSKQNEQISTLQENEVKLKSAIESLEDKVAERDIVINQLLERERRK